VQLSFYLCFSIIERVHHWYSFSNQVNVSTYPPMLRLNSKFLFQVRAIRNYMMQKHEKKRVAEEQVMV
jgi:hypothetical protein